MQRKRDGVRRRGGVLPEHPKKFSVVMVKPKSFAVNEQIVSKLSKNHFPIIIGDSEPSIFAWSLR
jgi:hypothetical protein